MDVLLPSKQKTPLLAPLFTFAELGLLLLVVACGGSGAGSAPPPPRCASSTPTDVGQRSISRADFEAAYQVFGQMAVALD